MSFIRNFNLNLPSRYVGIAIDLNIALEDEYIETFSHQNQEEFTGNKNSDQPSPRRERTLIDLNIALGDDSREEILHQREGQFIIHNDLNQPSQYHTSTHREGQAEFTRNNDAYQSPPNDNTPTQQGEEDDTQGGQTIKKHKMLSNNERQLIYANLLSRSVNEKLRKGTTTLVSNLFSVSTRTVMRIWKQSKANTDDGLADINHRKTKNCRRKRVEIDREQFLQVPLARRTNLRSLSSAINVTKSTLHRNLKDGLIRRHSNAIKPFLKESNKKVRVQFCLSMIDKNSMPYDPKFLDMCNVVHIDEKWFYISKKAEKYYLLQEECDPERSCKSKNFLTKVMFLAAIARPIFDSSGNELFYGKIGIFPFVTREPAKRNSANRAAGTLETKAMTSIGKDIERSFLIDKVLPAIKEKWPDDDPNMPIFIQQDNARTHIDPNDEEFRLAVARYGLNVQLICQPPNSPDLNVLDLGFFNAIQSLYYQEAPKTIDDLIIAVEKAFNMFSPVRSNHIFLTLQQCMVEIMKARGSNNYKIPHINKIFLERNGRLPLQIQCDAKLIEDVTKWINL